MPPRKRKVVEDTTVYAVTVSGKSYEAGVKALFEVKPVSSRKIFDGRQYRFELSRTQLRELADIMAELACPEEGPAPEAVVNAIYIDLARFPEAAGVR